MKKTNTEFLDVINATNNLCSAIKNFSESGYIDNSMKDEYTQLIEDAVMLILLEGGKNLAENSKFK
jgi:hypothetical protein